MEGRKPPPKASHPYPNVVELTKWWGTPMPWSFIKIASSVTVIFGSLFAINRYIHRNEKSRFKIDLTEEQMKQLIIARQNSWTFSLVGLRASFQTLNPFESNEKKLEGNISFDAPYDQIITHTHD